ncbi:DNA gyrase subunit A [Archaeoglobales archaeon]|nr:MAG: DNA gyrase subunit A [Archaeoglobales archaeon]
MELIREISEELKSSYIDYAMSVIVGRALPDVRDGLKPVQRRILYAMYEMGLTSNKPYKKCARIVGDVLGKYHPHGDSAVYDALVRMAQDFIMRYPLIDGQGNFGSVDGDEAAAMRYTEARLAKIAEEMLVDIDKETVDFIPNFDNTLKEPSVLPSKIPNLLINGSSGIAVGMATNIPPHNLKEVCDAIIAFIKNPEISVEELVKFVKGPDFPTGGIIIGSSGIFDAYKTGKGKIVVRGKVEIESKAIVIKEIPYMVNKARLVEKIAELIKEGRLEEVRTVRDESDREGIRVVVELRGNAQTALNKLYMFTNLQTTFGIINLALVDGEPRILNLKDLISEYVNHRRGIVRKRTEFELKRAEERLHIVEGLKRAVEDIDNVVSLIKASKSPKEAKEKLIERYGFSEKQADAILQMRLQKLTNMEIEALIKEYEDLIKKIREYRSILASITRIDEIIIKEVEEVKEKYGDDRRTQIIEKHEEISIEELITKEDNILVITQNGFVKRMDIESFRLQERGGVGIIGIQLKDDDLPSTIIKCNSHDKLLFFTNFGRAYWINAYEIPKQDRTARGINIRRFLGVGEDEKVVSVVPTRTFRGHVVILTGDGHIKRTKLSEFINAKRSGVIAGNKIAFAKYCEGNDIFISTKKGYAVRFRLNSIPELGRIAKGVKALRLRDGDEIANLTTIKGKGYILTLTEKGYGKRTVEKLYRATNRGTMGIINLKVTEKTGDVVASEYVEGDEELITLNKDGYALKISVNKIPVKGRSASGVIISRRGITCATIL